MNRISSESTRVLINIQKGLEDILQRYPLLSKLISLFSASQGVPYLVGGSVRDLILQIPVKDIDIEIHNLSLEEVEAIIKPIIHVSLVGKSFGVLKAYNYPFDFSIPRSDSSGRHPKVAIDPFMGIEKALRRRDLTMNALAINLVTGELIDPFGGVHDILNKVLRAPDNSLFIEDPLRFYRVMQFAARFDMSVAQDLNKVCASMDISKVSIERIEVEFDKLFLRAKRPSLGIRWLKEIGRLNDTLDELVPTIALKQEPEWHPEIYVFEHLMQTLDAVARNISTQATSELLESMRQRLFDNTTSKLLLSYAALCHDLGKVTTTKVIDHRIRSIGHAEAGVVPTKKLLEKITTRKKLIEEAVILVKFHMNPGQLVKQNASLPAYKRLAHALRHPLNLASLAFLLQADKQGRNAQSQLPLEESMPEVLNFVKKAQEAGVLYEAELPVLTGQDIADLLPAGPFMGKVLKRAYEYQINKSIRDKRLLRSYIINWLKTEKKK